MSKMVIGLASGSVEKLYVTSTLTGGAVALDMEVDIYLLLGGAYAFRKDVAGEGTYTDRPELAEEMRAGITDAAVPDPFDSLGPVMLSATRWPATASVAGRFCACRPRTRRSSPAGDSCRRSSTAPASMRRLTRCT